MKKRTILLFVGLAFCGNVNATLDGCLTLLCLNGGFAGCYTCLCNPPWTGLGCETCARSTAECGNGGVMNVNTCQCDCARASSCSHGGQSDANCACRCDNGWTGGTCSTCSWSEGTCKGGGNFSQSTCSCDCSGVACATGIRNERCECVRQSTGTAASYSISVLIAGFLIAYF